MNFIDQHWSNVRLSPDVLIGSAAIERKVTTVAHIWSIFGQTELSEFSEMPRIEESLAYYL
jgi:hypothetical protein